MVGVSEKKVTVAVLKQESLFFSAFNLLDQKATALLVVADRHPRNIRQHNANGLAARPLRQLVDKFLRKSVEQDGTTAVSVAHDPVQCLAPAHAVLCFAGSPDTHPGNDCLHLLSGLLLTVVVSGLGFLS